MRLRVHNIFLAISTIFPQDKVLEKVTGLKITLMAKALLLLNPPKRFCHFTFLIICFAMPLLVLVLFFKPIFQFDSQKWYILICCSEIFNEIELLRYFYWSFFPLEPVS